MHKIRVLVAESRPLLREALAKVLGNVPSIDLLSICCNGNDAIEQAVKLKPEIILLDGGLSECNCIEVARRIRELLPETRVVVLTSLLRQHLDPLSILDTEADGYIDIDVEPVNLIDAITRVSEGRYILSPRMAEKVFESFSLLGEKINTDQKTSLTKREIEVLTLVAKGLTNKEIGGALLVTESTSKAHLHSILKKLKVRSRAQAVFVAQDKGILYDQNTS